MTDRETFEAIQAARCELARRTHQDDLETKARLTRLLGDYHARKEVMIAKKGEEFKAKKAASEKKIKEEKEKRLRAVLKAREEEKARKEKEEQLRLRKEAEEARLEAGLFASLFLKDFLFFNVVVLQLERLAEEERQREEEAAAQAAIAEEARKAEEALIAQREARERQRQEALEKARFQQQREEEAEARSQARAAEKAAEKAADKAGLQRKNLFAPTAAAKEDSPWRRTPTDGQPARSDSPAPAGAKYKPPAWRARVEPKQAAGGGGEAAPAVGAPTPSVAARAAAQASVRAHSPVPSKEESKKDEDGFQTVPVRSTKEPWRPRRGRA